MSRRLVVAHGGTSSKPEESDGARRAAETGLRAMRDGGPVAAVVEACAALEDDGRFNAGSGAHVRFDGVSVEMDAAVMDSRGRYGAVSAVRDVKNPARLARELLDLPNNILTGEGATRFARRLGHARHPGATQRAKETWAELVRKIERGEDSASDNEWTYDDLRACWNYERAFEEVFPKRWAPRQGKGSRSGTSDTIGAVATDGRTFAAATSTGGTIASLAGRVGDSPNIGCGIFAGECGAVALTGNGDHILRERAATMVHGWLADGFTAQEVVRRLASRYADSTDVWAAIVGLSDHAGGGNRDIAWSFATDEAER